MSLSFSLLVSLSFSLLVSLSFSLFSLSNNDNDHSFSRFSLCTDLSNLPVSECVGHGPFLVGLTCSHHARNNCTGLTLQASNHLE